MATINANANTSKSKNKVYTDAGIRFYDVPVAPVSSVLPYSYEELLAAGDSPDKQGFKPGDVIRAVRGEGSVVQKVMEDAVTLPVTNDHPESYENNRVNRFNNNSQIVGNAFDPYIKEGKLYYKYLVLENNSAIRDYENGKDQLSIGFDTRKNQWGEDDQGKYYIEIIDHINHVAMVYSGRAGSSYKLHKKYEEINMQSNLENTVAELKDSLATLNSITKEFSTGMTLLINSKANSDESEDMKKDSKSNEDSKEKDKNDSKEEEVKKNEDSKEEDKNESKENKANSKANDESGEIESKAKGHASLEAKNAQLLTLNKALDTSNKLLEEKMEDISKKNDVFLQENRLMMKLFNQIPQSQIAGYIGEGQYSSDEVTTFKKLSKGLESAIDSKSSTFHKEFYKYSSKGNSANDGDIENKNFISVIY